MTNIGDMVLNILIKILDEEKIKSTTESLSELEQVSKNINTSSSDSAQGVKNFLENLKSTAPIQDATEDVGELDVNVSGLKNTLISFAAGGIAGVAMHLLTTGINSAIESSKQAKINIDELSKSVEEIADKKNSIDKLANFYHQLTSNSDRSTNAQDRLQKSLSDVSKEFPQIITGVDKYTGALLTNNEIIEKVLQGERELLSIRQEKIAFDLGAAIKEQSSALNDNIRNLSNAQREHDRLNSKLETAKKRLADLNAELLSANKNSFTGGISRYDYILGDIEQQEKFIKKTNDELTRANVIVSEIRDQFRVTKNQIDLFVHAGLKTESINNMLRITSSNLKEVSGSTNLVLTAFSTMSAGAIRSLMGVATNALYLKEILAMISTSQVFAMMSMAGMPGSYGAMMNMNEITSDFVKNFGYIAAPDLPPVPPPSGNSRSGKTKEEVEKLKTEIDDLNEKLKKETEILALVESQSGLTSNAYAKQIEVVRQLKSEISDLSSAYDPVANAISELNLTGDSIRELLREKLRDRLEKENKARLDAAYETARINAELIEDEHQRRLELIRVETAEKLRSIRETEHLSDEDKARLMTLTQQRAAKDINNTEITRRDLMIRESLNLARDINSILNLGSHTFVSQLISGLRTAYDIVTGIAALMKIIGSLGSFNPFGFLTGIFSGGSDSGGGASPVGGLPASGSLPQLFRSLASSGNFNSSLSNPNFAQRTIVEIQPTNIQLRGDQLRIVLDRSDKKINRYKN